MPGAAVYVPGNLGQTGQQSAESSGTSVRITALPESRNSVPLEQDLSGFAGCHEGLPLARF